MVAARQIQTPEIETQERPEAQLTYSQQLRSAIETSFAGFIGKHIQSISLELQEEQEVIRVTLSGGVTQDYSVDAVRDYNSLVAPLMLQGQITTFLQQHYPELAPESDISASRIAA